MKNVKQMHLLKKALMVLLMALPLAVFGQAAKFGHVDSQQLMGQMPDVAEANQKLDTLNAQYTNELKSLADEYQKKLATFQNLPANTSDAIKNNKMTELQQMEDRIRQFQDQAQQDLQKKNEEYFTPIQKKLKDAIKAVALEGHYSYIFDSSNGAVLYANDGDDITPLVKKKLGLKP